MATYIMAPKAPWQSLYVTHPHIFIQMKNFRRNSAFEILVLDDKRVRRRFCFATWFKAGTAGGSRQLPFYCEVPLRLEYGWNEVHVDCLELLQNTYKSTFVELVRIKFYANCRVRQVRLWQFIKLLIKNLGQLISQSSR